MGAGRREWLGLAVLALPTLLLAVDISVLYLALPILSAELGATGVQQLWIMDSYGFLVAGFLVTMGTLGDRIGRRRLLLIGAATFGVASMAAAYSTSPAQLIATRALMGVAGATVMPSVLALISNMFSDARQRSVAVSVWFSCFMAGSAIGPVLGGWLLQQFWWGSVFLLGVPVMAVLLICGPVLLPEFKAPQPGRLDLASVALSLAAILPVVYGVKELAGRGWHPVPALAIVAGIGFGVWFVRRQRTLADPLVDLRLFGDRGFRSALGIGLFGGIVMGGTLLLANQHLQLVAGLGPLQAGAWLVPANLAMVLGILVAPVVARRVRPGLVMATGLAVAVAGYLVMTQAGRPDGLGWLVGGLTVALFGNGLPGGLGVDLIVGSAPPEKAGSASSMSETSMELGVALGVAALGSVAAAVYRVELTGRLGTPPAGPAGESIAAVAQHPDLLGPARGAFGTALAVVAVVSMVVYLFLTVLAVRGLRHVPPYRR
jgi:DHA2 family multidrug resistance protein-like MFS transporter